jgi:hypothetical protein
MASLKARPTMFQGIRMRSRLEAGFAAWLDSHGCKWTYEPCAFASSEGQYLPDFSIDDFEMLWIGGYRHGRAYFEVKPDAVWLAERDLIARRLAVIYHSEPAAMLFVVTPKHLVRIIGSPNSDDFPPAQHEMRWGLAKWLSAVDVLPDDEGPWAGEYWRVD